MVHLKISPWKFGDSELGNHHYQVNRVKRWGVICIRLHMMGVSKNRDTPKWMVYNEKP